MRVRNKFLKWLTLCGAMLLLVCMLPVRVSAEVKEADFINHDGGALIFSFFYEVEKPDLVFISPSGVEYAEGVTSEAEMTTGHGEGWSTYQIPNAEVGQWRLRYDKKGNESIRFVEVAPVESIAIQSFAMTGIEGDMATVTFHVMKGEEETRYNYSINLVDSTGTMVSEGLATGWANTMEEQTVSVRLNVSTGQDYKLMLVVSNNDGDETFDSETTDIFAYTNPNTPAAITDFAMSFDSERSRCTVNWEDYRPAGYGVTYTIVAFADGDRENPVYQNEGIEERTVSFFYPTDASKLEVEVSYTQNGITSLVKTKTIDLAGGEYLKISAEDVVSDALLPLEYFVKSQTELKVTVNGVEGAYLVDGEDVLYLTLQTGNNIVEASFVGADNLVYSVSKEVFYTWVSPTILLFEDLEGMTFTVGNVPVSGKVEEAVAVKVNGVETEISEDGSFYCEVPIVEGKNTITVEAVSVAGVTSMQTITVIGEGKGTAAVKPETDDTAEGDDKSSTDAIEDDEDKSDEKSGLAELIGQWTSSKWFPTAVVAVVSMLVLLFFFLTLRDKKKKGFKIQIKNALIGFGVLEVVLGVAYFFLCRFNNSLEYVELAQSSVQKAALFLNCETYGKYVLFGIGGVILLLILSLLIAAGIKKLIAKNGERKEQRAALKAEKAAAKKSKNKKEKNVD